MWGILDILRLSFSELYGLLVVRSVCGSSCAISAGMVGGARLFVIDLSGMELRLHEAKW